MREEIRQAIQVTESRPGAAIYVVPVKLHPCDVPTELARWQAVDLTAADGFDRLERSLALGRIRQYWREFLVDFGRVVRSYLVALWCFAILLSTRSMGDELLKAFAVAPIKFAIAYMLARLWHAFLLPFSYAGVPAHPRYTAFWFTVLPVIVPAGSVALKVAVIAGLAVWQFVAPVLAAFYEINRKHLDFDDLTIKEIVAAQTVSLYAALYAFVRWKWPSLGL